MDTGALLFIVGLIAGYMMRLYLEKYPMKKKAVNDG